MTERLKRIKNQYEELCRRMEEPETYSDPAVYSRCEREARELAPLAEAYTAFEREGERMQSALKMLHDEELGELAQEEYQQAKEERERLEKEIRLLL